MSNQRGRRSRRAARSAYRAAEFTLQALERRVMMCLLDGTHIPEIHAREATETEPNNTIATANPFISGDAITGSVTNSADLDYWSTTLNQGDRLRLRPGTDPGQRHYKPLVEILNANGDVLMRSGDGHEMNLYAPAAGQYFLRIGSGSSYGTWTGSYGTEGGSNLISATVTAFAGTTEAEPNDTLPAANAVIGTRNVRGAIGSSGDVDAFSFAASAGQAFAFKFSNAGASNPSVRMYDASNNLIATDLTGAGLHRAITSSGTYRLSFGADNAAGPVTGGYVGTFTLSSSGVAQEVEPQNDAFSGAVAMSIGTTTTRALGTLASMGDVDFYSFNFTAGRWYDFTIDTNTEQMMRGGRRLSLFNEHGQAVESSYIGTMSTNAATGFGFRIERTGKHYLAVNAIDPTGLGGYAVTATQTSTFPTQRDVPLIFQDYTGQRTHLSYGPAAPLQNANSIPAFIGMFEARYDVYDVDITTTNPGTDVIGFGAGEFGSIGAYGYGGSFNLGTRRARGDSVLDDSGANFTSIANFRNAASVMNQEIGHAAGLYAHARNPQAFMAYDNQSAMNVIGSYYPFPWTDSRVPDVESRNEREFQDWVLQAGRIAEEVEPNNSLSSPQSLIGFMSEMTGDASSRNDRVALAGRIDSGTDVDVYSFNASAGQTFAIDIDSAELQHALDATVRVFDASGNVVASSTDAIDRDSGLNSVDPYLLHTFAAAGTYRVQVTGNNTTVGNYRLKLIGGAALETDGPRVIASWPNGGTVSDGTRQLLFWFNDKLDPATINASNIIVEGSTTGVRAGSAVFDPTDGVLVWRADAALPPDTYTVSFKSGTGGIRDMRGNPLDGETDGTMTFPEISGNGSTGGDFVTSFTINTPDASAATVSSTSIRRHPYNRVQLTLTMNDELDVQSVYANSALRLRGAGADNSYGTGDDYFVPIDVNYDKIKLTSSSKVLEVYTRGVPDFGNYRLEGNVVDAAGNGVAISRTFAFTTATTSQTSGPSVATASFREGSAITSPTDTVDITFSAAIDPTTLTAGSFVLRRSPDAVFFDGNDTVVADADGLIEWDPVNLTATFAASAELTDGYYMIEIDGDAGGVAAPNGALVDGDWLDSHIAGNTLFSHWQHAPTGDGFAGGDYRATFVVAIDTVAPQVEQSTFAWQAPPQRLQFRFSEDVGATLTTADIVLERLDAKVTIPSSALDVTFDPGSNLATITFPGLPGNYLPTGQYRITILAPGVSDAAGNAMAGDHVFNFSFLMGDADGNGVVNFDDYAKIDAGFLGGLTGFTNGDFNYDGVVNFDDYALIDQAFLSQAGGQAKPGQSTGKPASSPTPKPLTFSRR